MKRAVFIFAAGQGTRMKSDLPKVLHTIAHKPMLHYAIDLAHSLEASQIVVICSPYLKDYLETQAEKHNIDLSSLTLVIQDSPKGTGHAMDVGMTALQNDIDEVIVLYADVPLIQSSTLLPLLKDTADICFVSMNVTPPHEYGRLITSHGKVHKIVEDKDASPDERTINRVWAGVLKAKASFLREYLSQIPLSKSGEYYLTQLAVIATYANKSATFMDITDPEEFEGVNDKAALAQMEERAQKRLREKFMKNGVKLIAPDTVFFAHDTHIEVDAVIEPFVNFGKGVSIGSHTTIHSFCSIEESDIASHVHIGPFAHLRGHNHIHDKVTIGNFVEVKKTEMHEHSKAKHLAYLGDAEIGEGANIGAGAITCNYDGKNKHKTTVGKKALVGVNATLIAPVTLGDECIVGAGSVITKDVPDGTLALGRAPQIIKTRKPSHS